MLDEETENLYIQNIEEFVLDENKVVTYKWLSKTLGVHVNTAKQLLYAFATKSDEAKTVGIKKTFLISGILLDDGGCKVTVVQEENLPKIKDQFKIITSEHVYSVQKIKNNTSISDLYKIDCYQKDNSNPVPAISCNQCLPRTDSEVAKLRLQAEAATSTSDSKQWPSAPAKKLPTTKSPSKNENISKKHVTNGDTGTKEKTVESSNPVVKNGAKAGGIAAMFAAQGSRAQKSSESGKATVKSNVKGKGGIATFFNKNVGEAKTHIEKHIKNEKENYASTSEKKESENHDCGSSAKDENNSPEKKHKLVSETAEEESGLNKKRKISEDKKDSSEKTKKLKKNADVKSNNNNNKKATKKKNDGKGHSPKKRRRIIVDDSDSDDDIFEKDEDAASPPPVEEPEPVLPTQQSEVEDIIPCTPQQELNKGRKRIRKLIDKTYMDDDGYMITKKEFVYESCSESDNEEGKENNVKATNDSKSNTVVKKETENNLKESPKKKSSPPQKSKQATLMNFFKKS